MPEPPSSRGDPARIRDEIERRVGSDPAVAIVDIGAAVAGAAAIRVHVRSRGDAARLRREGLPASVQGLPVVLVVGDYELEEPPD